MIMDWNELARIGSRGAPMLRDLDKYLVLERLFQDWKTNLACPFTLTFSNTIFAFGRCARCFRNCFLLHFNRSFFFHQLPALWSPLSNSLVFTLCICFTGYGMSHSRWAQIFQKCVGHVRVLGSGCVTGRYFPTEDQQTLHTVVQNAVPRDLCTPVMQAL